MNSPMNSSELSFFELQFPSHKRKDWLPGFLRAMLAPHLLIESPYDIKHAMPLMFHVMIVQSKVFVPLANCFCQRLPFWGCCQIRLNYINNDSDNNDNNDNSYNYNNKSNIVMNSN